MKFEVMTPLGFSVRTSEEHWQRLLLKHPDIADLQELVEQALAAPDEVRCSCQDSAVVTIQGVTEECGFQALKIPDWYGLSCFRLRSEG